MHQGGQERAGAPGQAGSPHLTGYRTGLRNTELGCCRESPVSLGPLSWTRTRSQGQQRPSRPNSAKLSCSKRNCERMPVAGMEPTGNGRAPSEQLEWSLAPYHLSQGSCSPYYQSSSPPPPHFLAKRSLQRYLCWATPHCHQIGRQLRERLFTCNSQCVMHLCLCFWHVCH